MPDLGEFDEPASTTGVSAGRPPETANSLESVMLAVLRLAPAADGTS